jgi:hypothetical protein
MFAQFRSDARIIGRNQKKRFENSRGRLTIFRGTSIGGNDRKAVKHMRLSLGRIRGCRVIPFVLAVAWLPYVATRCVENPVTHVGCGMLPAAYAHTGDAGGHSQHGMASQPGHHHNHAPAHTCCDLTGKCNIKITPSTASLDPLQLVALAPVTPDRVVPHADCSRRQATPTLAHAPPIYLRDLTLLV